MRPPGVHDHQPGRERDKVCYQNHDRHCASAEGSEGERRQRDAVIASVGQYRRERQHRTITPERGQPKRAPPNSEHHDHVQGAEQRHSAKQRRREFGVQCFDEDQRRDEDIEIQFGQCCLIQCEEPIHRDAHANQGENGQDDGDENRERHVSVMSAQDAHESQMSADAGFDVGRVGHIPLRTGRLRIAREQGEFSLERATEVIGLNCAEVHQKLVLKVV